MESNVSLVSFVIKSSLIVKKKEKKKNWENTENNLIENEFENSSVC